MVNGSNKFPETVSGQIGSNATYTTRNRWYFRCGVFLALDSQCLRYADA